MLALVHKPCMFIVFDSFKFLLTYSSIKSPHVLVFFFLFFSNIFLRANRIDLLSGSRILHKLLHRQNNMSQKHTFLHFISHGVMLYQPVFVSSLCAVQVVLVFPGPGSVSVQDLMLSLRDKTDSESKRTFDEPGRKRQKCEGTGGSTDGEEKPERGSTDEAKGSGSGACRLQRVVFIDSTWNQTNKISTDERLQGNHERLHIFCFSDTSLTTMSSLISSCVLVCLSSSRPAARGAEDEEDVFLAASERQTRHLPRYYRGYLLFPQGLP